MVLREVAAELGVSLRTVSRDIQILRERGAPVEADRGRGGGVRLPPNWGVGRISLSYREAISLLISLAVTEQMDAPMMSTHLAPIQRKLVASFSADDQRKIKALRSRLRVGPPSSAAALSSFEAGAADVSDQLQEAFLMMRCVEIDYRSERGALTTRRIDVHYLVLNYPIWYALAWDHLRCDVRTFRVDRTASVRESSPGFDLRPWSDFAESMRGNDIIAP